MRTAHPAHPVAYVALTPWLEASSVDNRIVWEPALSRYSDMAGSIVPDQWVQYRLLWKDRLPAGPIDKS
jgi:hypothetical protein